MTVYHSLHEANAARQIEWDADNQITLAYRGNELAGEVGEACNVIKKLERERLGIRGSRDTVEHLAEELADIEICNGLIAMQAGIDLDAAVVEKFNATSEKMGLETRLALRVPAPTREEPAERDFSKVQIDSNFYMTWPKEEIKPGRFVDVDPSSLGLKLAVESLPRRKEKISGQTFSYVKLDDVLALIESVAHSSTAMNKPASTEAVEVYLNNLPVTKKLIGGEMVDVVEPSYLLASDRDAILAALVNAAPPSPDTVRVREDIERIVHQAVRLGKEQLSDRDFVSIADRASRDIMAVFSRKAYFSALSSAPVAPAPPADAWVNDPRAKAFEMGRDAVVEVLQRHFDDHQSLELETIATALSAAYADVKGLVAPTFPAGHVAGAQEPDWQDDQSADERWSAGLDYGQEQLCRYLGVDPSDVTWDAATETLDGDVQAVIGNILRTKFGEDWSPNDSAPVAGAWPTREQIATELIAHGEFSSLPGNRNYENALLAADAIMALPRNERGGGAA